MIDYTIFYKEELPIDIPWSSENSWDCFISAYNSSDRVRAIFKKANARTKHWLIQSDYQFEETEIPNGQVFMPPVKSEGEYIQEYFAEAGISDFRNMSICIDITGFIKPYIMFMIRWLAENRVKKIDILYSEPAYYSEKEQTKFSDEAVTEVRQVAGYAGIHKPDLSNDLLIIGAGYDDELIARVAEDKNHARKLQLYGFPSLRPDMYQENVLRAHKAAESVGAGAENNPRKYFAPANDPFVTAQILREILAEENRQTNITNLYLSPLATKPQALGFVLFYLYECVDTAASILYPFCETHSKETSKGLSRTWKYVVELPT